MGFGSGNDPEGSDAPNHGTSPNDNSVERKASAVSTPASLTTGGAEEFAGNGWDSNNNADDFVVQTGGRNPQNSMSGSEPLSADGSGSATVTIGSLKAGDSFDLPVTFTLDPSYQINAMKIVVPVEFGWTGSVDEVDLDARLQAEMSASGDTLLLDRLIFSENAATITVRGLTAPGNTGNYVIAILTSGSGTYLPIQNPPAVFVRGGPIPIAEARENNATGVPLKLGEIVTINGIVTVSNQFGSPAYVQDHTGGIAVYDFDFSDSVSVGDEVIITGIITQYNGLTEMEDVTIDAKPSSGNAVTPLVVTINDVLGDGLGGKELYESTLSASTVSR